MEVRMSTTSPDLDQLRTAAQDLLAAFRADDPLARKRIAAHIPRLARSGTELRLADAQFVVARENGYPSWPKLKVAVGSGTAGRLNGPSGPRSAWRRATVLDATRAAAESAERRDVEDLLEAFTLLGKRNGLIVRRLLAERGAYPAVVDTLLAGLRSPHSRIRFECAHALDDYADERCVEPLRRLLNDPVPRVRRIALHSLGCDICKPAPLASEMDFVSLAIEQAFTDPSIQVRRHAVSELVVRRADPRAAAAIRQLQAQERDSEFRRIIRREMGHVSE
jgi:hypothetical protein